MTSGIDIPDTTDNDISQEELSRAMRYLSHRRRIVQRECEICGQPTQGTAKRRFCSNTCAARAYRARKRYNRAHNQS